MVEKPRVLPATQVLIGRIGWLIRLRWLAVVGVVVFVEAARRILAVQLYPSRLYGVLGALSLYNLTMWIVLRRVRRGGGADPQEAVGAGRGEPVGGFARFLLPRIPPGVDYYNGQAVRAALFANVQIGLDLFFLAALLHFAGGIENPLRVFFVFHVIIASILLSRRITYAHATLGVLLLTAVALGECWGIIPHYSLQSHWRPDAYLDLRLVGTQLFLFAVTLYVCAYLASSIAARLRRREVDVVVLSHHLEEKAERLQVAYEEVSAAERAKSQYMRKVAHEIRGPLGTIKTALSVVLDDVQEVTRERGRELLQRAHHRAGELATMTQELLSLSRARGGPATAEFAQVDVAALVQKVSDDLRESAEEAGVLVTVELGEGLDRVYADAEALSDLVTNLLSNAIRYTPRRGLAAIRAALDGAMLVIEVDDTGIGIAKDDLPRIYEEFFRSKTAREFASEGSGLGMAIVKAVVDQHGGTITIKSEPQRGTQVTVRLPAHERT